MEKNKLHCFLFGGLLVVIGFVYLLFNIGVLPQGWSGVILSWQMLLVLLGIGGMVHRHFFWGILLLVIGVYFSLPELSVLLGFQYDPVMLKKIIWPLAIIFVGVSVIFNYSCRFGHKVMLTTTQKKKDGSVEYNFILNGREEIFLDPVFNGGEINCVLGGMEFDLRKTTLPLGDTVLKLSSVLGGVTLHVPDSWNVKIENESFLGEFVDNRSANGSDPDRRLIIKASQVLGGGCIR